MTSRFVVLLAIGLASACGGPDAEADPIDESPAAETDQPLAALAWTLPAANARLSGVVTLQVAPPTGTSRVTFLVDGATVGRTAAGGPWTLALDTRTYANGAHTLKATAKRSGGTTIGRSTLEVTFANAPVPPPNPDPPPTTGWWKPAPGTSWQWQLTGTLDTTLNVAMYDLDLFDTSAATIASLKAKGRRVICYLSAGSSENWRPDFAQFPAAALGKALDGWAGERWLDVRHTGVRALMAARLDLARSKGCDGVEPDNVDGYSNATGFPITAADQLAYNRFLATEAHARGLSVGLKNDVDQVAQLVGSFDWALNEECFRYGECDTLAPFIAAGKAVFQVEYGAASKATTICPKANALNFDGLIKNLDLNAWRVACR